MAAQKLSHTKDMEGAAEFGIIIPTTACTEGLVSKCIAPFHSTNDYTENLL